MITGYNHVCLTVSDLERSIDFYTEAFGFQVKDRFEGTGGNAGYEGGHTKVAFLTLGLLNLEMIQYLKPKGMHPRLEARDVGTPHLAFTSDNVPADYERLRKLGVRFVTAPRLHAKWGSTSVYGLDPDGIPFELRDRPW
ncbi:MAG: VOC family protein [Chloroflexi bacterium]|nr:VOC family protein [Chloroflexota bacterium]